LSSNSFLILFNINLNALFLYKFVFILSKDNSNFNFFISLSNEQLFEFSDTNNIRIQEQYETIKGLEAKYNIINDKLLSENSNNCSLDSEIKKLKLELSFDKINTNLYKNNAFKLMLNKIKKEFDDN
jgi:hypothetical protein